MFESTRLRPAAIAPTIEALVRNAGLHIEPKGIAMLTDYIGVDAAKLYNEIGKMAMILGKGATITPESIERNIGVSKDYNNFELIDAIASKDARKAFAIADYFAKNPKPTHYGGHHRGTVHIFLRPAHRTLHQGQVALGTEKRPGAEMGRAAEEIQHSTPQL